MRTTKSQFYFFSIGGIKIPAVLIFIFFFAATAFAQPHVQSPADRARIDSIFRAIDAMPQDTATVSYINHVYNDYLWQFNLPEAYGRLKYAVRLSGKLNYDKGEYVSYSNMAGFSMRLGNNYIELQNRLKALDAARRMNDSVRIVSQWFGIGVAYHGMGKDSLALLYELDALRKFRQMVDTTTEQGKDRMSRTYLFIAWTYQSCGQYASALPYIRRSLAFRRELNYDDGLISCFGTLRDLFSALHEYDSTMNYVVQALHVEMHRNNTDGIAGAYVMMGNVFLARENADSALFCFRKAEDLSKGVNDRNLVRDINRGLASALDMKGDIAGSYTHFREYIRLRDSISDAERANKTASDREMYDIESKNAQIELLAKNNELSERKNSEQAKTLWGLSSILLITLILAAVIFSGYRRKKRTASDLAAQKKIIEEKNNDITGSIRYARRIQHAILPSQNQVRKTFPESFVFYQPKDIVSGDFFWFGETEDSFYIAAADCTGHGVPGALMSMIGFNFLGQIVNEMHIRKTSAILDELHRKILFALNRNLASGDVKDGMDIALLRIFKGSRKIEFSGAVRPLYIVNAGKLNIIDGDIYSIGGIKDPEKESFSCHEMEVESGSMLYLFSDGYADQFGMSSEERGKASAKTGTPAGKKFKYRRLRELLSAVSGKPADEQQRLISETFLAWKGNLEQVDDILVIGIRPD